MYSVTLGFDEAENRIRSLISSGHSAEALVTCVFTVEKTLRRSLKLAIIARGFSSSQADVLIGRKGLQELKELWPCFAPTGANLIGLVGQSEWQALQEAVTMRNKLVHGSRVYELQECRSKAEQVLQALANLRKNLLSQYGLDGWARLPVRRKSKLTWSLPK